MRRFLHPPRTVSKYVVVARTSSPPDALDLLQGTAPSTVLSCCQLHNRDFRLGPPGGEVPLAHLVLRPPTTVGPWSSWLKNSDSAPLDSAQVQRSAQYDVLIITCRGGCTTTVLGWRGFPELGSRARCFSANGLAVPLSVPRGRRREFGSAQERWPRPCH